ncbi:hypothetical protein MKQ70_04425 [Chitinophaga sedimenti]|uniref:tetratricopeptide repeat protein n=1 Tax=Chitinophaga sedimenti TaxID=2033606 RepID=UPI002005F493|nr:hypothetical protein [Chitinophaga sedimenti]MCK7554296.1 hypothetical protein [Chitinophaga sedimenti]
MQSALSLAELGRVHFAYGAIDLAEGELLTADEQLKALGVQERSFVYECLSRLYVQKANGGKALYYAQATLENMRLNGKWSSDNAFYYVRVAEVYLTFGQTERYHSTLFKMLEGRNPATETDNYYVVLFARQINLKQGPAEAINYLSARLTNKKIFNDSADIAVGHMYIGDFYRQLGQSQKAMEYYLVAEKEMIPNDLYRRTAPLELNLRLATQLYDQGKYTNALEYRIKYGGCSRRARCRCGSR